LYLAGNTGDTAFSMPCTATIKEGVRASQKNLNAHPNHIFKINRKLIGAGSFQAPRTEAGDKMQCLMTFEEAADAIKAETAGGAPDGGGDGGFCGVCIDSREAKPGFLFAALEGEKTDGHLFARDAFRNGAVCALAGKDNVRELGLDALAKKHNVRLLVTEDNTLAAFQGLAKAYLAKFPDLLRVGITGSSGKTTTKEIFASIAAQEKNIVYNRGNFNSETGLPVSVFNVRGEHEIGVFEVAMNHPGEIAALAGILKPQIALIINTGMAHIGFIGSKRGIALEKKAILGEFTGRETAVIPRNDEFSGLLAENVRGNVRFFDEKAEAARLRARSLGLDGWELTVDGVKTHFPLPGPHNFRDAVAAVALAETAGLSMRSVRAGLESVRPLFGRSEVFRGKQTVIRDCYNANPQSMREAVNLCSSVDWPGRRVCVLAPMRELGGESVKAHEELGRLLISSKIDLVFLFAGETLDTYKVLKGSKPVFHTNDIGELKELLRSNIQEGDLVLIKGSHSCALERTSEVFSI